MKPQTPAEQDVHDAFHRTLDVMGVHCCECKLLSAIARLLELTREDTPISKLKWHVQNVDRLAHELIVMRGIADDIREHEEELHHEPH